MWCVLLVAIAIFQSTLPVWGATRVFLLVFQLGLISIHAPRVGSDHGPIANQGIVVYFNPRSPCGERLPERAVVVLSGLISIHAPRVGSD